MFHDTTATAMPLLLAGVLLAASALFSRAAGKSGLPVLLLFLGIGFAAGQLGAGVRDLRLAVRIGVAALAGILFDGGLNTPPGTLRRVLGPSVLLATLGVVVTALVVAVAAHGLGLPWMPALLVGAIVSSTDAAAVFSVLRTSGLRLRRRVSTTLEMESGLNDPMAIVLTLAVTRSLVAGRGLTWSILWDILWELAVGGAAGVVLGYAGRSMLRRARLPASGLYPVLTLGIVFVAYGLPSFFGASGFLAVYLCGIILGSGTVPYRNGLLRVHDALAWFAQVLVFLVLGSLASARLLWQELPLGIAVGLVLAIVARPVSVFLCLVPFRYPRRELAYIAWVGLRGAVPLILAVFPVLADIHGAARIFHVVFLVVAVAAVIPGSTVRWVTRRLGIEAAAPPHPAAVVEITSTQLLSSAEVLAFYVDELSAVANAAIAEVPLPEGAAVMLVLRGRTLLPAKGRTVFRPGDHVWVFCRPEDRPFVQLLFAGAGDED